MRVPSWPLVRNEEERQQVLKSELDLTQKILSDTGIKSYSTYLHRMWVIQQMPKQWETELKLCSELLKYDDRNCIVEC